MKGKVGKKLKAIKSIGYHLKPDTFLQITSAAADALLAKSNFNIQTHFFTPKQQQLQTQETEDIIDVSDLLSDLDDDDNKENIKPETKPKICRSPELKKSEFDNFCFRSPDSDSGSLFEPNLLAAFHQAVTEVKELEEAWPVKARKVQEEENKDPLLDFEFKCPPGGQDSVVLYTTGLRGIRKTFEDCASIRFLLQSFRVLYTERDVSMHSEFKEELWRVLGEKVVPPKLFIKGRYIGGADVVLVLHEQGKLRCLFDGIPFDRFDHGPCEGCVGDRFLVCFRCNGSRKIVSADEDDGDNVMVTMIQCPDCNENGLIVCPMCC